MGQTRQTFIERPGAVDLKLVGELPLTEGEVSVTVMGGGICSSDVARFNGRAGAPDALGHECYGYLGYVSSRAAYESTQDPVRERYPLIPGQRVAIWGAGGFADEWVGPWRHVVPIAESVPYPEVTEPLAGAVQAVETMGVAFGDTVLIIGGTGQMGLYTAALCARLAARVIVTGRRESSLQRALAFGATDVVNTELESVPDALRRLDVHGEPDIVIEATGSQDGLDLAVRSGREGGGLGILGFHQGPEGRRVDLERVNEKGYALRNLHFRGPGLCIPAMGKATTLLEGNVFGDNQLVSHTVSFDDIEGGFRLAAERPDGFVKAVVSMRR